MRYLRDTRQKEEPPWTMAMVSSSMGTINCLLHKLPTELKFTALRRHFEGIRGHILRYCARGVVTDMLDRQWMKQLRELAYDVEDWMDMLLIHSGARFKLGKLSSDDSKRLQEFKDQIAHVQELGYQFNLLGIGFADPVPSDITLDLEDNTSGKILHGDGMLYGEKPCVVGLDGPESEIVQHLIDNEQELKVVSILGPGGMGKTTLAKEVFRNSEASSTAELLCMLAGTHL